MNSCKNCGHVNPSESRFCTQCGLGLNYVLSPSRKLVMIQRDGEKAEYELYTGETFIGRGSENHIKLEDEQVSKRHTMIESDGYSWSIVDLGSKNGVFVNGNKVRHKQRLLPDSLIKLGTTIFKFELAGNGTG